MTDVMRHARMRRVAADEQHVAELIFGRSEALVRGDVDRLREILAPDFTYTNASGVSCDLEEYLAVYVTSIDVVWLSQDCSDLVVRVYGDAAVVTMDVHDRLTWHGEPVEGYFRSIFVCVRRSDSWQCVAGQTTVTDSPVVR
jgi:hypothetical protein